MNDAISTNTPRCIRFPEQIRQQKHILEADSYLQYTDIWLLCTLIVPDNGDCQEFNITV